MPNASLRARLLPPETVLQRVPLIKATPATLVAQQSPPQQASPANANEGSRLLQRKRPLQGGVVGGQAKLSRADILGASIDASAEGAADLALQTLQPVHAVVNLRKFVETLRVTEAARQARGQRRWGPACLRRAQPF